MRYSISQWIYGNEPVEKSMQRMAKFGYDGIEVKGEPDHYGTKNLAELMQSYDLEASSIAGMYTWPTEERDLANPNEKVRKRAITYVKKCVDFARELGAPLVIVVPSCVAKTKPLAPQEKEWKWATESVRKVGVYAEDKGILIAIEPINRYETHFLNNSIQALRFITDVGLANVSVMLDCFHMNIEESNPGNSVRRVGKDLIHVHVADSNRQSVGRGHTDFRSIVMSLKEIGYSRYLAMEPLPPLPDPYMAIKGLPPEEFLDLYAEECIKQLRSIEKIM